MKDLHILTKDYMYTCTCNVFVTCIHVCIFNFQQTNIACKCIQYFSFQFTLAMFLITLCFLIVPCYVQHRCCINSHTHMHTHAHILYKKGFVTISKPVAHCIEVHLKVNSIRCLHFYTSQAELEVCTIFW